MPDPARTQLHVAFDEAALAGRCDAIRGMLSLGLGVCGGPSGGLTALQGAAGKGHVEVVEILTEAGVRASTGKALAFAINHVRRNCVEFLLKHYERESLDHVKSSGPELLYVLIRNYRYFDPTFSLKLVRWIIDAGGNTKSSPFIHVDINGKQTNFGPPRNTLDFIMASQVKVSPTLVSIDRLFKQEHAVHANSWLWPYSHSSDSKRSKLHSSTATHILRKSAHVTSRVVLGGLLRYTRKEF